MLTAQRVNQLERDGWIKKAGRGSYKIGAAVQGYIKFLKESDRQTSKSASKEHLDRARAAEIAQRMEQRGRTMVLEAQAEALAIVDECVGGLRSDLSAVPARVTTDLAQRRRIEDCINDAFAAAEKRAATAAESSVDADSDLVDGAAEDNAGSVGAREPGLSGEHGAAGAT